MKLNNKGESYIFVILGIIVFGLIMIFGLNYKQLVPKQSTDTYYKYLRDSIITAGKNYIVANDYLTLEDYTETTFSKKEVNELDRNLNCQSSNVDCKQIPINELVSTGYLNKLVDSNNKEECETNNGYLIVARVLSNNVQKSYNYYYKINNVICGYKRLVNTSDSEYYIVENKQKTQDE